MDFIFKCLGLISNALYCGNVSNPGLLYLCPGVGSCLGRALCRAPEEKCCSTARRGKCCSTARRGRAVTRNKSAGGRPGLGGAYWWGYKVSTEQVRVTRSCWVSSGCKISTMSRRNITCFSSRELYLSVRCLHLNFTTVTVSREQRGNDLSKKNWEFAAPDNLYFTFSGQNLSGLSLASAYCIQ